MEAEKENLLGIEGARKSKGCGNTYRASINEGVLKVRVPIQELLLQERGICDVPKQRDVDLVAVGEVLESNGLEECHGVGEGSDPAGNTWRRLIQCDEGTCCRTGTGTGTGVSHSQPCGVEERPSWQDMRDAALWTHGEGNVIGRGDALR